MENEIQLTREIAEDFHRFAMELPEYPMDFGSMRELRNELMKIFGLGELAAVNILCGVHIEDYVTKKHTENSTEIAVTNFEAPGMVAPDFMEDPIKKEYALWIQPELNDRICCLEERAKELEEADYEYVDEGGQISDDDLRYVLPEHLFFLSDVKRAKELAMQEMENRYEKWCQIPYISQLLETKETAKSSLKSQTVMEYNHIEEK